MNIEAGDMYCPRCWGFTRTRLEMHLSHSDKSEWECSRCGYFEWPFGTDDKGRFTWIWDDQHPSPNPGCPWCQTRNIQWSEGDFWSCLRYDCKKSWRGTWFWKNGQSWKTYRWKIRVPVSEVPWFSGTVADLECLRRVGPEPMTDDYYTEECCRWPKSCNAFDPGFTAGKGPTELPIVWNDGYGWRSGPPNVLHLPKHLAKGIIQKWKTAKKKKKGVNPDARDCGQGCEYICRCY